MYYDMRKNYSRPIVKDTISCWFRLMLYRIILNSPIELGIVYYTSKFLYLYRKQVGKNLWCSGRDITIVNQSTHYHLNCIIEMRLTFKMLNKETKKL